MIIKKFIIPNQFRMFYKEYKNLSFRMLDIGCGNHSAGKANYWFKNCVYSGIDKQNYNNDETDMALMEKYYEIDLESNVEDTDKLPDLYYDVIVCSHIIEHITTGIRLIEILSKKIKPGGKIYIEFPAVRSLKFPKMYGTLNFCDDETHIRLYSIQEVANTLLKSGFLIKKAGTRRNPKRILFFPIILLLDFIKTGKLVAYGFWDILGFAEYVFAEKKKQDTI